MYFRLEGKTLKETTSLIVSNASKCSNILSRNTSKDERGFEHLLKKSGIDFRRNQVFLSKVSRKSPYADAFYIASLYFPKKGMIINYEKEYKNIKDKDIPLLKETENFRTKDISEISDYFQCIELSKQDLKCHDYLMTIIELLKNYDKTSNNKAG